MSRRSTWKRLGLFSLLGLVLTWLVSCGFPGNMANQRADGRQVVEFWTMQLSPQFDDYFKQLIAVFEQDNPNVRVNWVDVPWAEMERKVLTTLSAAGADGPDVINLNPGFASQLAERGAWMDLDTQILPEVRNLYLPNIWKASSLEGKTFGIPWYLTTRVAIYNTEILKQAGIEQPPATYTELAKVAKQVKEKTGKYAFFTTVVPGDSGELLESFVQMGVPLVDGDGKAAFNTTKGKDVFQYWVDLYQQGLMPKEVLTEGHRHAIDLYQRGDTALLASGAEFLRTIETNAPSVAKASASAPQITGETGKKNVAVMNLVIPKDTDVPEAALKFAQFVTNDENQLAFAKSANVLPSTLKALADSYFTTVPADATPVDQARIISAQQMKDAEVLVPAMKNVKQLQKVIYDNLQAAMLKQKSVDQAIADAAQQWNQQSSLSPSIGE